jgi:hypothetical protein
MTPSKMDPIGVTNITMTAQSQMHAELSLGQQSNGLAVIKAGMA